MTKGSVPQLPWCKWQQFSMTPGRNQTALQDEVPGLPQRHKAHRAQSPGQINSLTRGDTWTESVIKGSPTSETVSTFRSFSTDLIPKLPQNLKIQTKSSNFNLFLSLYFMCSGGLSACMPLYHWFPVPEETRKRSKISWNWSNGELYAAMEVLRIEPGSTARSVSALKH